MNSIAVPATGVYLENVYTHAILKKPGNTLFRGLTSVDLGTPDSDLARVQHAAYADALRSCGVEITVLEADDAFPDSVFVEDVALCLPDCVVLTNPGAPSRKGEVEAMRPLLQQYFDDTHRIMPPGTLDAGDVLEVGDHYYIGLSARTNQVGAEQLIQVLNHYGATGSMIEFPAFLHLKSGVSWLGDETLLLATEFKDLPEFAPFECLVTPPDESYAANAVRVNDHMLLANGYPATESSLREAGFDLILLDMSEFRKVDGGLSCLSLRF